MSYTRNRRERPLPPTRLDFAHPLAQGLVLALACNEGHGVMVNDLTQRWRLITTVTQTNTRQWTPTPWGMGFDPSAGTDTYLGIVAAATMFPSATSGTLAAVVQARSKSDTRIISLPRTSTTTGMGIQNATSGWSLFTRSTGGLLTITGGADLTNEMVTIVGTAQTGDGVLYINGEAVANNTSTDGPETFNLSTSATVKVGAATNGTGVFDGMILGAWCWSNRCLTAAEVQQFHANPWEMFLPVPARRHFVPAAPAGGQPMMLRGTTVPHLRQWHPRH